MNVEFSVVSLIHGGRQGELLKDQFRAVKTFPGQGVLGEGDNRAVGDQEDHQENHKRYRRQGGSVKVLLDAIQYGGRSLAALAYLTNQPGPGSG